MNIKYTTALYHKLDELAKIDALPIKKVLHGVLCYRVQKTNDENGKPYVHGFFFGRPEINLGRYNDPQMVLRVCYVADKPTSALAEVFGRRGKRNIELPTSFFIGSNELVNFSMATNSVTKSLNLLNIGALLPHLGKRIDELSGDCYRLTQDIVGFFSQNKQYAIDGIAYRSRHLDDGTYCYAMWARDEEDKWLKTISIETLRSFECELELPELWSGKTIDGEEILTDILGFEIVDDSH